MAGDWIKMRSALCTNPRVLRIAEIIGESTEIGRRLSTGFNGALDEIVTSDVTRDITLASLLRVWSATNEHTEDGVWRNSTPKTIDSAAGIPGFGEAMVAVGWAVYNEEDGTVTLPNFLENNAPAKHGARTGSAERQARYRARKRLQGDAQSDVTRDATETQRDTSQSDLREEKRRDNPHSPRKRGNVHDFPPGFERVWSAYPRKVGKGAAAKSFARIKTDASLVDAMVAAIEAQRSSPDWVKDGGQFIPHLSTWLNGQRWLDDTGPGGDIFARSL